MSTVETRLGIHLDVHCDYEECADLSGPLLEQLQSGRYDEMSVVNLQPLEDWRADHRTARKRADRAARLGYGGAKFNRHFHVEDLNAINRSTNRRQGRPMAPAYMQWQDFPPLPNYRCARHAISYYGAFWGGELRGYICVHRSGELALVSQLLGHADYLTDGIMYLAMEKAMRCEYARDPGGYMVYNRHDSGTDGLRFYKERCGFVPMEVSWCP